MLLTKISILSFGRLNQFNLPLREGLNVIYGPNEQGKSTLMAFVRMMFYGAATGNDIVKNPRKKYRPWDGSAMGGAIEFTHGGKPYRLERTFSASSRTDKILLVNLASGAEEPLADRKEIGRMFFGMGEESFDKSVFIGQAGTAIDPGDSRKGEIIGRLQNLVSTGDETESFTEVEARLKTALETIVSRSGRIGLLDRLESARSALEDARDEAIRTESRKAAMQQAYDTCLERKGTLESSAAILEQRWARLRDLAEITSLESILRRKSGIDALEKECDDVRKTIADGDFEADLAFLEESSRILRELTRCESRIGQQRENIGQIQLQLAECAAEEAACPPSGETGRAEALAAEIDDLRERIDKASVIRERKETELRAASDRLEARRRLLQKRDELTGRKAAWECELAQVTADAAARSGLSPLTMILYILAASVAILSAVLGAALYPPAFAGLALSAALAAAGFAAAGRGTRSGSRGIGAGGSKGRRKALPPAEARRRAADLELRLEMNDRDILDLEQQIDTPGSPGVHGGSAEDPEQIISTLRNELSGIDAVRQADAETLALRTREFDGSCDTIGVSDLVGIREIRLVRQNLEQKKMMLGGMLAQKEEELSVMILECERKRRELGGDHPVFFTGLTTEQALSRHEELAEAFRRVQSLRNLQADKNRELRFEMNGRPLTEIRARHDELLRSCGPSSGGREEADGPADGQAPVPAETGEPGRIEAELAGLRDAIAAADSEMVRIRTEMATAFAGSRELPEIEEALEANRSERAFYAARRDALKTALQCLAEAFEDMQQSFGPIVNRKTSGIFSRITGGRYNELIVGRDLSISVREPEMNTTKDSAYLSGGTIDQVYFALRLAIAGFFSEKSGGLPLFLDDSFLQYDDERMGHAAAFLREYADANHCQIILFTCRRSTLGLFDPECVTEIGRS